MAKRLFVGSIPFNSTEDTLKTHFESIGPVAEAKIVTDRFTGRSRGFGFIEFENDADADKAIADLNDQDFEGRNLVVNEARPMTPRADAPAA